MRHAAAARRLGEVLVDEGLLAESVVVRALSFQKTSTERLRLGTILLNWELLDETTLLTGLAKLHRCPAVPWAILTAAPLETVLLLSASQASRLRAVPYASQRGLVRVAFADPSNIAAVDETASLTGRRVAPAVCSEARLLQAHRKFYGRHIPLEYRGILQRLDRRARTRSAPIGRASEDQIPNDRPVRAPEGTSPDPAGFMHAIPISSSQPAPGERFEIPEIPPLDPPEPFHAVAPVSNADSTTAAETRGFDAQRSRESDSSSLSLSEDSLSEWVGEALAAFTGEASEPPATSLEFDGSSDPDSPSGVADPAIFGRNGAQTVDAREDFADPDRRPSRFDRAVGPPEMLPLTEAHRRAVPESIPPFRRAGDPIGFFLPRDGGTASPLEREDAVVAGMWRPAPEEVLPPDPMWNAAAPPGDARWRDEIADSVLRDSLASLPRVLLLGAGRTGVVGWRGRGRGLTPEAVAAIRVPHSEISVFSAVQQSGVPHFAVTERSEWPRALADLFGSEPLNCAIFPIRVLDGVAAFLYADRMGEPMHYEDFALIARAAASAAGVLSRFLLQSTSPESRAGF